MSRNVTRVVAFLAALVFLVTAAGIGIDRFVERTSADFDAEQLEVARWNCVETFVRRSTTAGERLRLQLEPDDDTYIRQRVVESVYPDVDLTATDVEGTLRVTVRPGDDLGATCRGLDLSVERP